MQQTLKLAIMAKNMNLLFSEIPAKNILAIKKFVSKNSKKVILKKM